MYDFMNKSHLLLGECSPTFSQFAHVDRSFEQFATAEFQELSSRKKFRKVNETLLQHIVEHESPCFLLYAALSFIDCVNDEKIVDEPYSLTMFEFWLNHFSELTPDETLQVRGKLVGRFIPRDEYQVFFPVGMGKFFPGSHFVAAHLSPDVDTTVSSFWGWMDAFGCRVAEGTHQWSLPEGLADGHIKKFFQKTFGANVFAHISRKLPTITLTARDLLKSTGFIKVLLSEKAENIEHNDGRAVVIVDDEGLYRGEWRSKDAEAVRHVVVAFSSCLRWFEGQCQARMIRALANDGSTVEDIEATYAEVLDTAVGSCGSAKEIPDLTKQRVHEYMVRVLGLENGLQHTFEELLSGLDARFGSDFSAFLDECHALSAQELFDAKGKLLADRVQTSKALERVVGTMEAALDTVRDAIERIAHLLEVKHKVLEWPSTFVTLRSDVDEMRSKIDHYEHLTVAVPEKNGEWFPVGVVRSDDLAEAILGTVSFRDFSNPEETKMASYVEVISIVDHHKMRIQTSSAPTLIVGDAQSTNTLVAEQSLRINERYQGAKRYFVDPYRELTEYFFYLYGILDDTDLLTKISRRDVMVVKSILDRMRTILNGEPTEAVSFVDIENDASFVKNAAKALLRNKDLHSIYASVYQFREQEMEKALLAAIEGQPTTIFLDTKEQNGCCRVGQTKLFRPNVETFDTHKEGLLALWQSKAEQVHAARPQIDFFAHMISTVPSEQDVFHGQEKGWEHKDEFWIWSPESGVAEQHLVGFLNSFQRSSALQKTELEITTTGPRAEPLALLVKQNFSLRKKVEAHVAASGPSFIIFRYKAGAMNSRKSQVSPFLPKLIS